MDPSANIVIPFYSSYGTTHRLAQAVRNGASDLPGSTVRLRRIPELSSAKDAMSGQDAYEAAQANMTDILTSLVPLLHLGMVFVGVRYSANDQMMTPRWRWGVAVRRLDHAPRGARRCGGPRSGRTRNRSFAGPARHTGGRPASNRGGCRSTRSFRLERVSVRLP
ncbi:hypothetical protein [Salinibacter sp. 10B]|uniref:hypothetical protein n=1 Tax=Salinibacter sp. 10B TaxID=1923971 RepID=UPI0011B03006|nr:hypothetical protein [Salinibacter sp. 10B]